MFNYVVINKHKQIIVLVSNYERNKRLWFRCNEHKKLSFFSIILPNFRLD